MVDGVQHSVLLTVIQRALNENLDLDAALARVNQARAAAVSAGALVQNMRTSLKLLIVDKLGYVPLSQTGAELLFEVFSQRYERGATIVTSNLPFEDWTSVFGVERLTGARPNRLTHHVHILKMNGEIYRLEQSRARRRKGGEQAGSDPRVVRRLAELTTGDTGFMRSRTCHSPMAWFHAAIMAWFCSAVDTRIARSRWYGIDCAGTAGIIPIVP